MTEIPFDNVDPIRASFSELTAPRSHVNRFHLFGDLLVSSTSACCVDGSVGPSLATASLTGCRLL